MVIHIFMVCLHVTFHMTNFIVLFIIISLIVKVNVLWLPWCYFTFYRKKYLNDSLLFLKVCHHILIQGPKLTVCHVVTLIAGK